MKYLGDYILLHKEMPKESLCVLTHIHHANEKESSVLIPPLLELLPARSFWALLTGPKLLAETPSDTKQIRVGLQA